MKRNDVGTEKSEECSGGTQKKNEKERAAGDEQIELHVYYARTGQAQEREGHQLAVVAYRDGQLYCICTMS